MAPQERNPYKKCERKGVWGKEGECEENFLEPSGHAGKVPQERLHLRAGAVFCPREKTRERAMGEHPSVSTGTHGPQQGWGEKTASSGGWGTPGGGCPPARRPSLPYTQGWHRSPLEAKSERPSDCRRQSGAGSPPALCDLPLETGGSGRGPTGPSPHHSWS